MNLRISTTLVESFRRYLANDDVSAARMDADIMGAFVPTRQVELGSAFDRLLERPALYYRPGAPAMVQGITFPEAVVVEALAAVDPRGLAQVKATREYAIGDDVVTLVAKFDRVFGARVREYKTRWSTFDIDAYRAGCQWRFYLDVSGADAVDFTVFVMAEYESGEIGLKDVHSWAEYPYPRLHEDCVGLLRGLVDYVHARGLERYCGDRGGSQAAVAVPA